MKKNFEQHFWGGLGLLIVIFLVFTAFLFFLTLMIATGKTIKPPLIIRASKLPKDFYGKLGWRTFIGEDKMDLSAKAEIMVEKAKTDLSKKIGVEKEKINLVTVEEKDWPDTSLGCPQPGMFYAQVITPGFKITLEGGGKNYTYHSDYKRIVLCPSVK